MKNPLKKLMPKRQNKSKEQIRTEMKMREDATRQKDIFRRIYPILLEHTESVAKATQVTEVMSTIIMQAMQLPFKDKNVGDLNLEEELVKDKEKGFADAGMYEKILAEVKDVSIADAMKIFRSFGEAINAFYQNRTLKTPLSEIPLEELI